MALAFSRPLSELFETLPAWELTYWQAFEQVEGPIGYRRADVVAAFAGYMSERIRPRAKPDDALGLFWNFLETVSKKPEIDPSELEPEERVDLLTDKVLGLFGETIPPDILEQLGKADE